MTSMTANNNELRLENLETKTAYQDRIIEDLNEVVIKQQQQIDRLIENVGALQKARAANADSSVDSDDEPPPPHY